MIFDISVWIAIAGRLPDSRSRAAYPIERGYALLTRTTPTLPTAQSEAARYPSSETA